MHRCSERIEQCGTAQGVVGWGLYDYSKQCRKFLAALNSVLIVWDIPLASHHSIYGRDNSARNIFEISSASKLFTLVGIKKLRKCWKRIKRESSTEWRNYVFVMREKFRWFQEICQQKAKERKFSEKVLYFSAKEFGKQIVISSLVFF